MFPPVKVFWGFFMDPPYVGWYFVGFLLVVSFLKSLGKSPGGRKKWVYSRKWFRRWRDPEEDLEGEWPYRRKQVISPVEQVLFHRLVKSLPDRIILTQVQLIRIIGVSDQSDSGAWWGWHNRISQMSVDFVVCSKGAEVLAVIELDDSSHGREDRQVADKTKDKALRSAGVRVIRWQSWALPDEETIRSFFPPSSLKSVSSS